MKNLKSKKVVTATEENMFYSDTDILIQKMQRRIDFLQGWLDDVSVRDASERAHEIRQIINEMSKIENSMVTYYVLDNYGHKYFSEEVDTEFKIELAAKILDYVKSIYPNYKNELLENIAINNSEYTANYIYVENV